MEQLRPILCHILVLLQNNSSPKIYFQFKVIIVLLTETIKDDTGGGLTNKIRDGTKMIVSVFSNTPSSILLYINVDFLTHTNETIEQWK